MLGLAAADWAYALVWQVRSLLSAQRALDEGTGSYRGAEVLVLPGVYESWRFLQPLIGAVRGAGHRVHVVPGLGLNSSAIPASAVAVREHVDAHGLGASRGLVIVGHSKGGLIGKHLMVHLDHDQRFRAMVTVNTPFSGSRRARWLPLPAVRVFVPGGAVLSDLERARDVNARITSVYSAIDPNIPGSSRLEGAENVVVDAVGHFRVLSDPRLQRAVLDALERRGG